MRKLVIAVTFFTSLSSLGSALKTPVKCEMIDLSKSNTSRCLIVYMDNQLNGIITNQYGILRNGVEVLEGIDCDVDVEATDFIKNRNYYNPVSGCMGKGTKVNNTFSLFCSAGNGSELTLDLDSGDGEFVLNTSTSRQRYDIRCY